MRCSIISQAEDGGDESDAEGEDADDDAKSDAKEDSAASEDDDAHVRASFSLLLMYILLYKLLGEILIHFYFCSFIFFCRMNCRLFLIAVISH